MKRYWGLVLGCVWLILALLTVIFLVDHHSILQVTVTFIAWLGGIVTVLIYFEFRFQRMIARYGSL